MLVPQPPGLGEALLLDQTSETEKLYLHFAETMIGLTGLGGIENSQNSLPCAILGRSTLETDPCRRGCQTLLRCGMVLVVVVGLCALEDEQTGNVAEAARFCLTEMALVLEVDQGKAGVIAIETGKVQMLNTKNALTDGAMKGPVSEMIEIGTLFGGTILRLPVTVPETKRLARRV